MIDFHSHILPNIDDGSRNVKMSLEMVYACMDQSVDTVCATPHYYATHRTPEHFLERRQEAWEALDAVLPEDAPHILLGAEVLYFPGISRMEELPSLCLEGTNILLLEMPFDSWSEYYIREVRELACSGRFTVMLAHIERYYAKQPVSVWDEFLDLDILMQANADFFIPFRTKRKALNLLKEGRIHVLGSDAHNMTTRPPRLDEARAVIESYFSRSTMRDLDRFGRALLEEDSL